MSSHFRTPKAALLSLVLCAGLGCADDADDSEAVDAPGASSAEAAPLAQQTSGSVKTIKNPKGTYIANVEASGDGCPVGSWDASVSSDGQVFTMTFSSYEIKLSKTGPTSASLDCEIDVGLVSPAGLSYAVTSFTYQGYALLEAGMSANIGANYNFSGLAPARARNANKTIRGPYDDSYLFEDVVGTTDWSPCGTNRSLNILTTLSGRNSSPKQEGYMNVASLDASTKTQYVLKLTLASKACQQTTPRR